MPELDFDVDGVAVLEHAAAPTLLFKLRIDESDGDESIHNVLLQCQIQIETMRRKYSDEEQAELADLFGTPDRWRETLRGMHWTRANVLVPAFQGQTFVDLPVPCSYDFNLGATKYFAGLESGDVPLLLLFSGTVFYRDDEDTLQVMQIPWSKEARFRLPVDVWRRMMQFYYPNCAWLCLRKDLFDRLQHFKREQGLPTWEQTMDRLLEMSAAETPS
jgi:hypothetical protein